MDVGPIFRAMMRNKLGVLLVAVQIAFTMTVMVNAIFIINERSALMARPSGLDEETLFHLRSVGFGSQFDEAATVSEDLDRLRQLPGIANATVINAIPVSGSGSSTGVRAIADPDAPSVNTAIYRVDDQALDTMGLDLVTGEDFDVTDFRVRQPGDRELSVKTIISEALALELFPEQGSGAIGRTIYMDGVNPVQVVGIVKQLQAPWPQSTMVERSMMVPENMIDGYSTYLVRAEPGQLGRMMIETEELLATSSSNRLIMQLQSLAETREESYRVDSAMSTILIVVIVTLLFITSMGIVGLAVFGINRRRKQIGTRRALGATKREITAYFMTENLLITGIGVTVGAILTLGFNVFLVQSFNMSRIDWYYTPIGMLTLIVVGLVSVLGPSRGAAKVPPALATRSV